MAQRNWSVCNPMFPDALTPRCTTTNDETSRIFSIINNVPFVALKSSNTYQAQWDQENRMY